MSLDLDELDDLLDEQPDERRERRTDAIRSAALDRREGMERFAQQALDDARNDEDALRYWVRQGDYRTYLDEIDSIRSHGRPVPDVPWSGREAEPVTELERRLDLGRTRPFGKEE